MNFIEKNNSLIYLINFLVHFFIIHGRPREKNEAAKMNLRSNPKKVIHISTEIQSISQHSCALLCELQP